MTRDDFRFSEPLRVRWAEIDAQKIVFNGHYLMYFDTAIAGYWRALRVPYAEAMAWLGGDLYVKKATLEYHASARYDDRLELAMRCARIGTSSMTFAGAAFRRDEMLVSCELVYVYADPSTQTSRPVPPPLRATFEGYEAGASMIDVQLGDWATLAAPARRIREAVFIEEQGVPIDMEWDTADATAVHAVAFNRLSMPLATGRLLQHAPGVGRIGRMASLQSMRGEGLGRQVLDALIGRAATRGDKQVCLSAQLPAQAFYERAGFVAHGPAFQEAGIAHIEMSRAV